MQIRSAIVRATIVCIARAQACLLSVLNIFRLARATSRGFFRAKVTTTGPRVELESERPARTYTRALAALDRMNSRKSAMKANLGTACMTAHAGIKAAFLFGSPFAGAISRDLQHNAQLPCAAESLCGTRSVSGSKVQPHCAANRSTNGRWTNSFPPAYGRICKINLVFHFIPLNQTSRSEFPFLHMLPNTHSHIE